MKRIFVALVLLGICGYFLFFHLGHYGFLETTDARYAEIGWEMFKYHDFITPHFDFIKHFHKPPFTYWMTALGYQLWGENEFGARFFLGVFGLLTLGIVFLIGKLCFNERIGALSALILLSMLGFLGATHVVATDLYVLFFICLAMYLFLLWERGKISLLWCWAVLGLSAWVKGPVAPVIVGSVALVYLVLSRQLSRLKEAEVGKGIALFLLLGLPWYVWVSLHNKGLFMYFIKTQLWSRVETGTMGHPHPWYYYLPLLPALIFPWTLYTGASLVSALRHFSKEKQFFVLWAIVPLVLYSLMKTKLPFYILPCLPPLAILTAVWWEQVSENDWFFRSLNIIMAGLCLILVLGSLAMAIPLFRAHGHLLEWQQLKQMWYAEGLFFLLIAIALIASLYLKQKLINLVCLLGISYTLCLPLLHFGDKLPINTYRVLGQTIYRLASPNDLIIQYKCYLRSLPFYVKRPTILVNIPRETQFETNDFYKQLLINEKQFWQLWHSSRRIFCVVPKRLLKEFLGQGYVFVTQRRKYVVITNKPLPGQVSAFSTQFLKNSPLALAVQ